MSENPHGSTHTQAFSQGAEHFPDATSRGLESIQDRAVADAEFGLAGLALEVPDVFVATVAGAADEGVDLVIGDAVIEAVAVGTGVPSCRNPFPAATRAFDL